MAQKSAASHSYLVLKEDLALPRGSLVEWRAGSYYEHSHLWYTDLEGVSFKPDDLHPLTEEECVLLDAIEYPVDDRYAAHNALAWGVGLKVGDIVMARLQRGGNTLHSNGVVRSIGVHELYGDRSLFGIEITVSSIISTTKSTELACTIPTEKKGYLICRNENRG